MAPCLADPSLRCAALALEGDDGPGPSGEIGRDGAPARSSSSGYHRHCYNGVSRILLTLNGESLARVFLSGNRDV